MIKRIIRHRDTSSLFGEPVIQKNAVILLSVTSLLVTITAWSYWPVMVGLYKDWKGVDDYSAGQLVPLVALIFIWRERKRLKECTLKPFWSAGIALILLALAGRAFGLLFIYESAERYSLVLTLAGLVLMVAGWQVFRCVLWIVLFLFLMVPFPGRIHNIISGPLRSMATVGSMFIMEAFIGVTRQGNVLTVNGDTTVGIAEACSGLRMLTAFIIVAAFIAYMVKRSRLQKAVLLFSSIPVAIICNMIRIIATIVLWMLINAEVADQFFHDFAGVVMMPAAVLLLFSELWLMNKLVESEPEPQQIYARKRSKTSPAHERRIKGKVEKAV